MTWDKSLPGDQEKIRKLGEVIRPNWEAIEEGDDVGTSNMLQQRSVQFDNRTGLAANNDPVTNAGTHYFYSKDDGGGTQEAFTKDSAGNIIQLTNDGRIGAADQTIEFNQFTNDGGTTTYDEKNFVAYWARVNAAGTILAQSGGVTCARIADSRYTVTFTAAQSSVNYGILITPLHTPGNARMASYDNITVNDFRVLIYNQNGSFITAGSDFTVTVYGGRPT